jgi:hypothetical protein
VHRLALLFCCGAASVFAVECLAYWNLYGDPLYRLAQTSGQAAPVDSGLHIAGLWRWDAYLRCLFLLPHQVGLFWWFGVVATLVALWRGSPLARGLAASLLAVAAFLQFGSNSLTSYVPLPKSVRYTTIAAPLLILLLSWWLSDLWNTGRRRWAAGGLVLLIASALPCVSFHTLTASERTRNTLALADVLRERKILSLYTDFYSARALDLLMGRDFEGNVLMHADFNNREMKLLVPLESLENTHVLIDRQYCKVYTSSYEMDLPAAIDAPPAEWKVVWTHRAYPEGGLARWFLTRLREVSQKLPPNALTARVERNVRDMIDGDEAVLYFVPPSDGGEALGEPAPAGDRE